MMNTTTKKLSTLRMGAAALAGAVGLAVVGSVTPAIAFADPLRSGGSSHHGQSLTLGWWIFIGAVTVLSGVLSICLVIKLRKTHREHYLWFVIAASFLTNVIADVRAGKPFIFELIGLIAALLLAIQFLRRNRQLKR